MKNENYYVGFDIGTDSVGYAAAYENYELCKFKGNAMWGVTMFDGAQLAVGRRSFRAARRRLERRRQRVQLIMDLFAEEIVKNDPNFFKRIKESYLYPETPEEKVRLFESYQKQKEYITKYPTVHHLICELMNSKEPHDARLVYIACSWLVAHRGHFLNDVDKNNVQAVTDFEKVYDGLVNFIKRDGEYALPWNEEVDLHNIENALKSKSGILQKTKALTEALFPNGRAPKRVNEQYAYNYALVIKLLCGGTVPLKELFDKEEYAELEEKSVALNMDEGKLNGIMKSVGEDSALISALKPVYDWSVLVEVLKGKQTISEAKKEVYEQHQSDLKLLKGFAKKYLTLEKYREIFRYQNIKNNYAAYVGKNKTYNNSVKIRSSVSKEEFCKYILSVFKGVTVSESDIPEYDSMILRLEANDFMPKQVEGDNRVIPYQLYWFELNKILNNAKEYIPFLSMTDEDGISGAQKVLSVFEFKVPYYVGPLKEKSNPKLNHWMVRKAEGKIYPWNFEKKVDLDASENAFIARMTNSCTYLPGEDVLPKNSLIYSSFEVLNEINNIKINGNDISVDIKQKIYNNVFMNSAKVTVAKIKNYLISNNYMTEDDEIGGIDITLKSSLKPFLQFKNLISGGLLTYSDAENIIKRAAYSEDKARFGKWLQQNYSALPEKEIKYISGLNLKNFGRLSRKLLCGIGGINRETAEVYSSIIRAMWETNCNLMQILSDRFTFWDNITAEVKEYYDLNPQSISERLDEMYISNAVKRPIIRTLDILKDVVKVQKRAPERIFIEMTRGSLKEQKGKRTKTRLAQIYELYEKVDTEDVRLLKKQLEEWGDTAHNKLQSDKIFLYFIQLGKCLYTGESIELESVISGDGIYNIDHIYPQSFIKDDSVINNKVLVSSIANKTKAEEYPVPQNFRNNMQEFWIYLKKIGLMSNEKFKRLTRNTQFTADEKFEFINRQLVETGQAAKAVAVLLGELYPKTKVVYVKAGLVSEFRHCFELTKSRAVNDLHHAKDAYLNIVAGNVWYLKYSKDYWKAEEKNNAKVKVIFTHPVICNGKTVWNGVADKDRTVKIARKNNAHITMYSYCNHSGQNGGFFDQNPLPAAEGLIPLKKDRPTNIYGGYNSATVTGFVLVKYKNGKKTEVSLVPLKLLHMANFIADNGFVQKYIESELGKNASETEILLNKRIIKIYTMLSLNGARYCIRGKASSTRIGLMNMTPFITSPENERYIKKLENLNEKRKNNENFIWDENYDEISVEKNIQLYNMYVQKLSCRPFNTRPSNETFLNQLQAHSDDFAKLDIFKQAYTLLQIQGIFGRVKEADLTAINGKSSSGIATLALNLSNWKENYSDVRIIDQSSSGLYEKISDNLLDLL